MRGLPRPAGDVLLGLFAVAVLGGAVVAVTHKSTPPSSTLTTDPAAAPTTSATPTVPAVPAPSPSPTSRHARTVVLAGPDLVRLQDQLAALTGDAVETVAGAGPEVLAPGGLDSVTDTPSAVVLEVLAGSKTTVRATAAITAVQNKWPGVRIVVVGPFSSGDRKSAAAVKTAALAAKVTFLDPVALKWRTADSSATLTDADLTVVTNKLAAALA